MGSRGPLPQAQSTATKYGYNTAGRTLKCDSAEPQPDMPEWLTGEAQVYWESHASRLWERGYLTAADVETFSRLCKLWAQVRECDTIVARDGITTATAGGGVKQHPAIGIRQRAEAAFLTLADKFCLTPAARQRAGETIKPAVETPDMRRSRQFLEKYLK